MATRWAVVFAVFLGAMMDEYIFQMPAALSNQLRNSTACQELVALIEQEETPRRPAVNTENALVEQDETSRRPMNVVKTLGHESTGEPCLHLGPLRYNMLYVVSALGTALSAPFYQLILRRFGSANVWEITSSLTFLTMVIFAIAGDLTVSQALTTWLVLRGIQGITRGLNFSAALRILSKSSENYEDSIYITGLVLFADLGGALNFWITGSLSVSLGLASTLWINVAISAIVFIPAIIISVKMGRTEKGEQAAVLMQSDIARASLNWRTALARHSTPATYWWLVGFSAFTVACVQLFISNAPQMIQDMGHTALQANYAAGLVYVTGFLLPILSFMVDNWDRKDLWLAFSSGLLLLGFSLIFLLKSLSLLCFFMGLAFALQSILVPSCIARSLAPTSFRAGVDCLLAISSLGVALLTLVTGGVLQAFVEHLKNAWINFLVVETLLAIVAGFMVVFAVMFDSRIGGRMRTRTTNEPNYASAAAQKMNCLADRRDARPSGGARGPVRVMGGRSTGDGTESTRSVPSSQGNTMEVIDLNDAKATQAPSADAVTIKEEEKVVILQRNAVKTYSTISG